MDRGLIPQNAFIEPSGKNVKEVRELALATIDLIINSSASAKNRPPLPTPSTYNFGQFPKEGLTNEELLKEIEYVLDGSMNPLHPNYWSYGFYPNLNIMFRGISKYISK